MQAETHHHLHSSENWRNLRHRAKSLTRSELLWKALDQNWLSSCGSQSFPSRFIDICWELHQDTQPSCTYKLYCSWRLLVYLQAAWSMKKWKQQKEEESKISFLSAVENTPWSILTSSVNWKAPLHNKRPRNTLISTTHLYVLAPVPLDVACGYSSRNGQTEINVVIYYNLVMNAILIPIRVSAKGVELIPQPVF